MKSVIVVLLFFFSTAARAQTQAIVPFPPGGALDALARIMAQTVAEQAKESVE
jgi:tripartite-type tricarboxylate transporter receptor subunit TctC